MKFTIEIECDNAAFEDSPEAEVVRILQELVYQIRFEGDLAHALLDINGNRVGRSTVEAS